MFARPPSTLDATPHRPSPSLGVVAQWAANPFIAVGGAGALLILAAGALILVAGDPNAGAPSVRGRLRDPARLSADALHGPAMAITSAAAPAADLAATQAVITLPQGGHMLGGAPADAAIAEPPARPLGPPLPKAPIAGLSAPGPGGLLPIVARDGRASVNAYARPFTSDGRPRIALVVGGLGLNASATRAAIERLPAEVTLSFVPYADGLQTWVDQARAAGHEVVLELPMEPIDYPNNDPGPYTLMAQAAPAETVDRLDWLLSRATGYFAVTNYLGGRFLAADQAMATLTGVLRTRGVGFIDDGSAARRGLARGVARGSADAVIDLDLASDSIAHALATLEATAQAHGQAMGAGFAYPITVEQVTRWSAGLSARGYQLAPVSAIMRR